MNDFWQFVVAHGEVFQRVWFFFVTLFGAAATQVLSLNSDELGATPFLKQMWPGKEDIWYIRRNFLIIVCLGTVLSYVILEPNTLKTSLCAGLTWCGTLQSIGLRLKGGNNG